MSFRNMVLWVTMLLVYIMATRNSLDQDTWWHLRAGQWMIENRQILTHDLFSYTRNGESWRYPGWIVEIPMAAIVQTLGLGGLNLASGLLITAALTFLLATIRGNLLLRAFLVIFVAIVSSVYWSARPHLITFLFAALFLYLLELGANRGFRHFRKPLGVLLPILMFVWVNSHGGFIVGFLLFGIYFLEALVHELLRLSRERLALRNVIRNKDLQAFVGIGLLMGLLANLNPLGAEIFFYPFRTVSIQALEQYIQEWQSPNFHELNMQPFLWLIIGLLFVSVISKKRWLLRDFLLVSTFFYMALMAARNIALFALVAALPISRLLADFDPSRILRESATSRSTPSIQTSTEHPKLNLVIVGILLIGCIYRSIEAYSPKNMEDYFLETYPVRAIEYLREKKPPGQLLNSYNWGAYLLWVLPEYPVFVDGRTDLYNDEILDQWFQVVYAKDGWEHVLERWQIRIILMEKEWIMAKYVQQYGWCQRYQDEVAIILEKCR